MTSTALTGIGLLVTHDPEFGELRDAALIIDEDRIASQSPVVVQDLLRDELGFEGAVITDSLEAQAVLDRSEAGEAAVGSVEAGVDLILMTGSGSWNLVYPALLERAKRDEEFRARVRASAARVLALKKRLGLKAPRGGG